MNTRLEIASRLLTLNSYPSDIENALSAADRLIAAEEATRKPVVPRCGTVADYRIDLATAQIAYDENPSAKNASILNAAKEALARRQQ